MVQISVIGAGAWGRTLAQAVMLAGGDVCLWGRSCRPPVIPSMEIAPAVGYTSTLHTALQHSPHVILAIPVQAMREVLHAMRCLPDEIHPTACLLVSKGMEQKTALLPSEIVEEFFPQASLAVLGGPNIAGEMFHGHKAGATIASTDHNWAGLLTECLHERFLLELSQQVVGVQVMGALKNVMAIGYGFLQALETGENQLATYLVKALQEMTDFAKAVTQEKVAQPSDQQDFRDLSVTYAAMGDLVLSCTSAHARNARFGREYGCAQLAKSSGSPPSAYLAEGVFTATAALQRAGRISAPLPLVEALAAVLSGALCVREFPQRIISSRN